RKERQQVPGSNPGAVPLLSSVGMIMAVQGMSRQQVWNIQHDFSYLDTPFLTRRTRKAPASSPASSSATSKPSSPPVMRSDGGSVSSSANATADVSPQLPAQPVMATAVGPDGSLWRAVLREQRPNPR
ncbi:hypothetical protein Agub_g2245, partial [Astrephomene gubernaculifera]